MDWVTLISGVGSGTAVGLAALMAFLWVRSVTKGHGIEVDALLTQRKGLEDEIVRKRLYIRELEEHVVKTASADAVSNILVELFADDDEPDDSDDGLSN